MTVQTTLAPELLRIFERQTKLCDDLEAVADSLPNRTDRQFCLHLARQIGPLLKAAHDIEEKHLFPAIIEAHGGGAELVERLRLEHIEDECFGEEVQHELMQLGQGRPVLAPEATGYMLRGFFEGMRRHMRHELELMGQPVRPAA
ncbi:MAG: hemerythrin domain-containing protein [Hyphomicrobiales bacterium]|nr:MAG: hemerythrin domain-containing protein [Hyphomicrobiales bacterium]